MQFCCTYLQKPHRFFYFRHLVPKDLRLVVGRRELKRCLDTDNVETAMAMVGHLAAAVSKEFDHIRALRKELDALGVASNRTAPRPSQPDCIWHWSTGLAYPLPPVKQSCPMSIISPNHRFPEGFPTLATKVWK